MGEKAAAEQSASGKRDREKPLRHGLAAVPPPLSGEALPRRVVFSAPITARAFRIAPLCKGSCRRRRLRGWSRNLRSAPEIQRLVPPTPPSRLRRATSPYTGEVLPRRFRKFAAAKTSPSRLRRATSLYTREALARAPVSAPSHSTPRPYSPLVHAPGSNGAAESHARRVAATCAGLSVVKRSRASATPRSARSRWRSSR